MVSPGLSSTPAKSEPIITDAGAGGDGLGDIAGVLDAAVGDDRNAAFAARAKGLGDGGDLRHAGAGDHARGADRAGPDADLDRVGAGVDQCHRALVGGNVAGEQVDFGELLLDLRGLHRARARSGHAPSRWPERPTRLATSSAARSRKSPVAPMAPPTRRRPLLVLAGIGVLQLLLDVLDGDQALQLVVVVDDQQLFDAVLVQDELGLFERGADGDGDEVFLGHHVADGNVGARLEAQVAVGEDADELACPW